jgi:hypothetical protein
LRRLGKVAALEPEVVGEHGTRAQQKS